jgi:hypothetical protein
MKVDSGFAFQDSILYSLGESEENYVKFSVKTNHNPPETQDGEHTATPNHSA